jgi:hypothetical protein
MSPRDIPQREASKPSPEESILAAQIRVKLDRQDRIPTPEWIVRLANSGQTDSTS